ncbi:MAG: hypothetical protein AB7Q17_10845 [Phycisphaerae bacterium]
MNTRPAGEPFCSNCGYTLTGLTESSKCPECGRALVEVLTRGGGWAAGRRWRSDADVWGLPLVHLAFGPHGDERIGRARGIVAIGDAAVGVVAIGNATAVGVIALAGGAGLGVVGLGGFGAGLLAVGGGALGGLALGGGAVGGIATGGGAIGVVAQGGGAVGYYVRAGGGAGKHVIDARGRDPQAVQVFTRLDWLLGPMPVGSTLQLAAWAFVFALLVAMLAASVVGAGWLMRRRVLR